jgi:hypothetical protein
MTAFSFVLYLGGKKQPPTPALAESRLAAIEKARDRLSEAVADRPRDVASCIVFAGDGDSAEAMGAWDYDPQSGEIAWSSMD